MKVSFENVKVDHYKLLVELAKVLDLKISKVKLSEDEYLLSAMEAVKDEPIATEEEVKEFEIWLKSSTKTVE